MTRRTCPRSTRCYPNLPPSIPIQHHQTPANDMIPRYCWTSCADGQRRRDSPVRFPLQPRAALMQTSDRCCAFASRHVSSFRRYFVRARCFPASVRVDIVLGEHKRAQDELASCPPWNSEHVFHRQRTAHTGWRCCGRTVAKSEKVT